MSVPETKTAPPTGPGGPAGGSEPAAPEKSAAPDAPREAPPPRFSRRRFVAGLLLVAGLAFAGVAAGVASRGGFAALRTGVAPDPGLLLIALGLMCIDVWLGGLRVHHLAHRLARRVTLADSIRADLGNRCLAGITPWQTGGGAAQLYILQRAGLPLSGGVAVGTINFLVSTVVLVVLGLAALPFVHRHLPGWLQTSTDATLGLLVVVLILGGLLIAKGRFRRSAAPSPEDPAPSRLRRWADKSLAFIHRSLEIARRLLLVHRGPVLNIFPITAGLFATKILYTIVVYRAFQPEGHVAELIGVTVILVLALNFAPTPGGSGVVEGSAAAYLADPLGPAASVGFVLYWRLLTLYLPLLVGGLILLHQMGRDSRRLRGGTSQAPTRRSS